jgi:cytochrome c biogenesis factor
MPWLVGNALIFTLWLSPEKRGGFIELVLCCWRLRAFSLGLLGTFLVRSGAHSVHAFATDPDQRESSFSHFLFAGVSVG